METCSNCFNEIPDGAEECPHCAGGSDFRIGPELQIEGLEPRRRSVKPPAATAVPAPKPDAPPPAGEPPPNLLLGSGGVELDLDDAPGGSFEVDDSSRSIGAAPVTAVPVADEPTASAAPPAGATLARTAPARAPAPAAPAPAADLMARARELAGYGSCSSVLSAPMYALRVRKRRAELLKEVVRLRTELQRQEREAEEAMARIGRVVRQAASREVDLVQLVDGVSRAEADATDREAAVRAADASTASISETLGQKVARIREDIVPLEAEAARIGADLRAKQDAVRRVKAQLRREEIEIRNLKDLANAKDTEALGQTDPVKKAALVEQAGELRAKIPDHETQRAAHEASVAEVQAPVPKLEHDLREARRRVDDANASIGRLEAEGQKEVVALDKAKRDRLRVLESAQATVRTKLADLARTAVARGIAGDVTEPLLPEARGAASLADATRRDLELYTASLDAFERERLNQGYLLLGGAAILLVALIGLLFAS